MKRIIAMIPTYNEGGHIKELVEEVLERDPRMEVLVVDDDSPDGTWRIVEEMTRKDSRVHLLRRTCRRGRGWAGIEGLKRALAMGADAVIEMDGDYSHHPREIPRLIDAIDSCDLAVGSRSVAGGSDGRTALWRSLVTRLAAAYIRSVLGARISDPTSGYRCYRRHVLDEIGLSTLRSRGPSIVEEILHRCLRLGVQMKEVPIAFEERRSGESKLNLRKLLQTAWFVGRMRFWGLEEVK
jgi:dolichol-phosphate mannosyltransferase